MINQRSDTKLARFQFQLEAFCMVIQQNCLSADDNIYIYIYIYVYICKDILCIYTYINIYTQYIFIHIYIYIYHHHHVVPPARTSLTLSCHFSLSFIASSRSSGLHPISSQSCCMYVRAGRPTFAQPYVGVHRSTSLMSLTLLLQQFPACLVHLTWIVFMMGGRWPYSWCFVGCCLEDLFNIARNILV